MADASPRRWYRPTDGSAACSDCWPLAAKVALFVAATGDPWPENRDFGPKTVIILEVRAIAAGGSSQRPFSMPALLVEAQAVGMFATGYSGCQEDLAAAG